MAESEGRESYHSSSQGVEGRVLFVVSFVEPGGRGKRVSTLGAECRDSYLGGRGRELITS